MAELYFLAILQGLGVAQAAVTECWPQRAEKTAENQQKKLFKFKKSPCVILDRYLILTKDG